MCMCSGGGGTEAVSRCAAGVQAGRQLFAVLLLWWVRA
jgi:hypothetical protein